MQSEEFNKKISEMGINCPKCLDTKLLWKNTKDTIYFIVIRCDMCVSCFDTQQIVCKSKTSNLSFNNIPKNFSINKNNKNEL